MHHGSGRGREAAERSEMAMINDMMGSGMMWGMGLAGIIGAIAIVLVIAALIKYLFFRRSVHAR